MRKSRRPAENTSKLKQVDIFAAFETWKSEKVTIKDLNIKTSSSQVIVIEDSDTEASSIAKNLDSLPKKKRPLAHPFSEDEEDNKEMIFSAAEPDQTERNMFPKVKRPLPHNFSPEYDSDETENNTNYHKDHIIDGLEPLACSTPLPESHFNTNISDFTYININQFLEISQTESNTTSRRNSFSSIDSERTIIVNQNSPNISLNKTIHIRGHVIVPPSLDNSDTSKQNSSTKKRCAEPERSTKKLRKESYSSEQLQSHVSGEVLNEARTRIDQIKNGQTSSSNLDSQVKHSTDKWLSKSSCSSKKLAQKQHTLQEKTKIGSEPNPGSSLINQKNETKTSKPLPQQQQSVNINEKTKINDKNHSKNAQGNKRTTSNAQLSSNSDAFPSKIAKIKNIAKDAYSGKDQATKSADKSLETSKLNKIRKSKNSLIGNKGRSFNKSKLSPTIVKKEDKATKTESLQLITDLFRTVISSRHMNNLLENEKKIIRMFLDMEHNYQYTCLKLITWKRRWYNIFKFCRLIKLDMEEIEISEMFTVFEENGIVDTQYLNNDNIIQLLEFLDNSMLRSICDNFRLNKSITRKPDMISQLLKYCRTQPTLNIYSKSTKDLLMKEIKSRMGRCIKTSDNFLNALYTTFVLGTFTFPQISNIRDYFASFGYLKVQLPVFPIDEYTVFTSRSDFISFVEAKKSLNDLENVKDYLECLQICRTIFEKLKNIAGNRSNDEQFTDAPHLIRFTAKSIYVSALSMSVDKLFAKFPQDVKVWLEYMIEYIDFPHKIGVWYYHLIWLYMKYIVPFDYDHAAELLIEVLDQKREHLSEVQLYKLRERGKKLNSTIKYKILQDNHDRIAQLLPKRIKSENFPEIIVDAKAIRSNDLGKKRNYELRDNKGNKIFHEVESVALKYYLEDLGYTGGVHCENGLVRATFTLFFFDIIYSKKRSIPGTFITRMQHEPLDMNSRYFYSNRKEEIDKRLKEIEHEWPDAQVMNFLKKNYEQHSHEYTVCEVDRVIEDVQFLDVLVTCIGRKVLAKIYQRLVKNFREYRSGLPDLLVWNVNRKTCKFVEVKGENDKLSISQALWLDYLQSIGAEIQVCHVHSIGTKKKIKKVQSVDSAEASTSFSSN